MCTVNLFENIIPTRLTALCLKLKMHVEIEHFFTCPHCWEEISMVLDLSEGAQRYIEDCEVCCRPLEIRYSADENGLVDFDASGQGAE